MNNAILEKLVSKIRRTDLPSFVPGDTVRVHVKIKEGEKERVQAFEGPHAVRGRVAGDEQHRLHRSAYS